MKRATFLLLLSAACGLPRGPVDGTVTQGAGGHPGIDFGGPPFPMEGRPIASPCAGTVAYAGPAGDCGNSLVIDHANGYRSRYCHLSGYAVATGQGVGTNQTVGFVGHTGYVIPAGPGGAHLHFEFYRYGALLVNELNGAFAVGETYGRGQLWGAGLNPALSCL